MKQLLSQEGCCRVGPALDFVDIASSKCIGKTVAGARCFCTKNAINQDTTDTGNCNYLVTLYSSAKAWPTSSHPRYLGKPSHTVEDVPH